MLAAAVTLGLGATAASVEYGQYTSLMRQTATADVEQLCKGIQDVQRCPAKLAFPQREAKDPWGARYRCRNNLRGAIVYTLGADTARGGTGRDSDIACSTFSDPSQEVEDTCVCSVGADATNWLR
jgi:hypothetical protein